jgi:hypothetical protein
MLPRILAALLLAACGAPQVDGTPDETGDLELETGDRQPRPTAQMPQGIDGTHWRWIEAHCTEGPLDLLARGYAAHVRVQQVDNGLTLVNDQVFATERCAQTLITRASPPDTSENWDIEEVGRVAVPSTRECFGRPEERRPGEVRVRDGRLEVLVQRSQWCNGLEVRMVYERAPDEVLTEDEIVRRYAAYFTRGDADAVAALFAESGSLLEPFTRTDTGDPYRHDGRGAVQAWYAQTFETAPWRALRITSVEDGPSRGGSTSRIVQWEYMDPRLREPLTGRTRFTIAAGAIFEAAIELTSEPSLVPERRG